MALAQGPERILDLHAKHPTTIEERKAPGQGNKPQGKPGGP
jgi:hypothetical protein